jgi:hypothetical protein
MVNRAIQSVKYPCPFDEHYANRQQHDMPAFQQDGIVVLMFDNTTSR